MLCVAGVLMFISSTVLNSDGLHVVATQQKPNEKGITVPCSHPGPP